MQAHSAKPDYRSAAALHGLLSHYAEHPGVLHILLAAGPRTTLQLLAMDMTQNVTLSFKCNIAMQDWAVYHILSHTNPHTTVLTLSVVPLSE